MNWHKDTLLTAANTRTLSLFEQDAVEAIRREEKRNILATAKNEERTETHGFPATPNPHCD